MYILRTRLTVSVALITIIILFLGLSFFVISSPSDTTERQPVVPPCTTIEVAVESCMIHTGGATVKVSRNAGTEDLVKLQFLFTGNQGGVLFEQPITLAGGASQEFTFVSATEAKSVAVAPLMGDGSLCSLTEAVGCSTTLEKSYICSNGGDEDLDGWIDLADPDCIDASDMSEAYDGSYAQTACSDGIDNDNDGKVDGFDSTCEIWNDISEKTLVETYDCSNGMDDDLDGKIDLADPGCINENDDNEDDVQLYACNDGVDNDGDGWIDLIDLGCSDTSDNDESLVGTTECSNQVDNDADGLVDGKDPDCSAPSDITESVVVDETKQLITSLVKGGNGHTIHLLYMGNSRVARGIGFAYDGLEEIVYEKGRLAGNGFIIPAYKAQQATSQNEELYLSNRGRGMTTASEQWWDENDVVAVQHAYPYTQGGRIGLTLTAGREVQLSSLASDAGIAVSKSTPVTVTVDYLVGPGRGTFSMTPIETNTNFAVVSKGTPVSIATGNPGNSYVASAQIILPAVSNAGYERAFLLTSVSGTSVIYRVSAVGDVPNGVSISEMGIGAHGYELQDDESTMPATSWNAYISAQKPDLVLWMFAHNDLGISVPELVTSTKRLMDRVEAVDPDAVHVILIDTPSPRANTVTLVDRSKDWANQLTGYQGAFVVDPTAYLPDDFKALAGTCATNCQYGAYFNTNDPSGVHETRVGARAVGDAVWKALEVYAQ